MLLIICSTFHFSNVRLLTHTF